MVKVVCDKFKGEEDDHTEPIEHVMDGGTGESTFELIPVPDLSWSVKLCGWEAGHFPLGHFDQGSN